MLLNFPEPDPHRGVSGRTATGLLKILVGFTQLDSPNTISIIWILLDACSTDMVVNKLNKVRTVCYCTEDQILLLHTNGGSKRFTNIALLKLLPLDIHINENYMGEITPLKYVAFIPSVHIKMGTSKERAIIVDHGEKN